jgi:hypothetical protein
MLQNLGEKQVVSSIQISQSNCGGWRNVNSNDELRPCVTACHSHVVKRAICPLKYNRWTVIVGEKWVSRGPAHCAYSVATTPLKLRYLMHAYTALVSSPEATLGAHDGQRTVVVWWKHHGDITVVYGTDVHFWLGEQWPHLAPTLDSSPDVLTACKQHTEESRQWGACNLTPKLAA